jgi:hypothetical protein
MSAPTEREEQLGALILHHAEELNRLAAEIPEIRIALAAAAQERKALAESVNPPPAAPSDSPGMVAAVANLAEIISALQGIVSRPLPAPLVNVTIPEIKIPAAPAAPDVILPPWPVPVSKTRIVYRVTKRDGLGRIAEAVAELE